MEALSDGGEIYTLSVRQRLTSFVFMWRFDPRWIVVSKSFPIPIPNVEQTIQIMHNLKAGYEKHHKITVSMKAVDIIIKLYWCSYA